jgi:hypothetical protein
LVAICLFSLFKKFCCLPANDIAVDAMYRITNRKCQEKNDKVVEK